MPLPTKFESYSNVAKRLSAGRVTAPILLPHSHISAAVMTHHPDPAASGGGTSWPSARGAAGEAWP